MRISAIRALGFCLKIRQKCIFFLWGNKRKYIFAFAIFNVTLSRNTQVGINPEKLEAASELLRALAHPLRLQIVGVSLIKTMPSMWTKSTIRWSWSSPLLLAFAGFAHDWSGQHGAWRQIHPLPRRLWQNRSNGKSHSEFSEEIRLVISDLKISDLGNVIPKSEILRSEIIE